MPLKLSQVLRGAQYCRRVATTTTSRMYTTTTTTSRHSLISHFSPVPVLNVNHVQNYSLLTRQLTMQVPGFDNIVSETLETLTEALEELPDFIPDVPEIFDVEYNGEVLTLKIREDCTYVINKQTPNQQIWLSSPISGPKRYDFVGGQWIYSHDSSSLIDILERELSELLNFEFELNTVRHCLLPFS